MMMRKYFLLYSGIFLIIGLLGFGCREQEQYTEEFTRGRALYSQQKLDEALICFESTLSKNRKYKQAYVMAAKCYYYLDREAAAREKLEKVLQYYPEYVDANFWMAKIFYFTGDYSRTEEHLLRVLEEDSSHIEAHYLLGDIYLFKGSFEKALVNYGIVEESLGVIALSKIRQGEIYARSEQYELLREELIFIDRNKDVLDYHVLDEAYGLLSRLKMVEQP